MNKIRTVKLSVSGKIGYSAQKAKFKINKQPNRDKDEQQRIDIG